MEELVEFFKQDHCIECGSDDCIICKCNNNKEIPLSDIIDDSDALKRISLSSMYCKNCRKEYLIDWSEKNRLPKPMLINLRYNILHDK